MQGVLQQRQMLRTLSSAFPRSELGYTNTLNLISYGAGYTGRQVAFLILPRYLTFRKNYVSQI